MNKKLLIGLFLFSNSLMAQDFASGALGEYNFAAPSVSTVSDVSDKQIGAIVYQQSDNTFQGYINNGGTGQWIQLSAAPNSFPVTSVAPHVLS